VWITLLKPRTAVYVLLGCTLAIACVALWSVTERNWPGAALAGGMALVGPFSAWSVWRTAVVGNGNRWRGRALRHSSPR
jgi:hypothetical protein